MIGIIHGRFQVFHNGHLEYALQARAKSDLLIIGITNFDLLSLQYDATTPHRSQIKNNPFTYYERSLMIKEALLNLGIERTSFEIVPFPINQPELICNYIPQKAIHFTRIYDQWNRKKVQLLKDLGYKVEILYESQSSNKTCTIKLPIGGIGKGLILAESGTDVRRRILENNDWQNYVPQGTAEIIKNLNLTEKLRA